MSPEYEMTRAQLELVKRNFPLKFFDLILESSHSIATFKFIDKGIDIAFISECESNENAQLVKKTHDSAWKVVDVFLQDDMVVRSQSEVDGVFLSARASVTFEDGPVAPPVPEVELAERKGLAIDGALKYLPKNTALIIGLKNSDGLRAFLKSAVNSVTSGEDREAANAFLEQFDGLDEAVMALTSEPNPERPEDPCPVLVVKARKELSEGIVPPQRPGSSTSVEERDGYLIVTHSNCSYPGKLSDNAELKEAFDHLGVDRYNTLIYSSDEMWELVPEEARAMVAEGFANVTKQVDMKLLLMSKEFRSLLFAGYVDGGEVVSGHVIRSSTPLTAKRFASLTDGVCGGIDLFLFQGMSIECKDGVSGSVSVQDVRVQGMDVMFENMRYLASLAKSASGPTSPLASFFVPSRPPPRNVNPLAGIDPDVSADMRERILDDIKTKNEKTMLSIPTSIKMTRKENWRDISVVINNISPETKCFCAYPHLLNLDGPGSYDTRSTRSSVPWSPSGRSSTRPG